MQLRSQEVPWYHKRKAMSKKAMFVAVLAAVLCAIADGILMADPVAVMKLLRLK